MCWPAALQPRYNSLPAGLVVLTRNAPPDGCVFVGEVLGSQGNFWTAEFTSDEDLIVGARNRMRDEAYAIGANFVQIELENQSHNTADLSAGGVFSSVVIGNGYHCPEQRRPGRVPRVER